MKTIYHAIIYGKFYAKKNSQRTIWHKYLKRVITVYTANYTSWEKDAMKQLGYGANGKISNNKTRVKNIDYPIILKCHFYNYDKRKRDISNFYEGIQDLLVKMNILEDDNYHIIIGHDGSRMYLDKENPRLEFWILKADEKEIYQK